MGGPPVGCGASAPLCMPLGSCRCLACSGAGKLPPIIFRRQCSVKRIIMRGAGLCTVSYFVSETVCWDALKRQDGGTFRSCSKESSMFHPTIPPAITSALFCASRHARQKFLHAQRYSTTISEVLLAYWNRQVKGCQSNRSPSQHSSHSGRLASS